MFLPYRNLAKIRNDDMIDWTIDKNEELPIKIYSDGPGSLLPKTMIDIFLNTCDKYSTRNSLFI